MSKAQIFDVPQNEADIWADEHAPFAERLQHDGDAPRVGRVDSVAAIWMAACGGLTFAAFMFAAAVYWSAGSC